MRVIPALVEVRLAAGGSVAVTSSHLPRSYYPNGQLKTDTLRIAKADWGTDSLRESR
jgi:hypothetical protein